MALLLSSQLHLHSSDSPTSHPPLPHRRFPFGKPLDGKSRGDGTGRRNPSLPSLPERVLPSHVPPPPPPERIPRRSEQTDGHASVLYPTPTATLVSCPSISESTSGREPTPVWHHSHGENGRRGGVLGLPTPSSIPSRPYGLHTPSVLEWVPHGRETRDGPVGGGRGSMGVRPNLLFEVGRCRPRRVARPTQGRSDSVP